jgi:hypothetical protein
MRRPVLPVAVLLVAIVASPAAAATSLHKVLGGPEAQTLPFANDTYLIWTQNSTGRPNHYNAWGGPLDASSRFRLNATGTAGFTGGLDPDENVAIYQQVDDGRSTLFTIDLDTRLRTKLPSPVNSPSWEWAPRISNGYYLFQRDANGRTTLYLYDRTALTLTQLHSVDFDNVFMFSGMVGESYATWSVCGRACNAFVYDIAAHDKTKLPVPLGKHQYAPAVDEDTGTVYFVRSGDSCGSNVGIYRRPVDLSTTAQLVKALPAGIDTGWTLALEEDVANNRLDAWFEYYRCTPEQGDLFEAQELRLLA